MTLANLLADVYRRTLYSASPSSDVVTRITAFVNEAQQDLASRPSLARLLRSTIPFTTTTSVPTYGLPVSVARILNIQDTAHRRRLVSQSEEWWRWMAPDPPVITGTPAYYIPLGYRPVASQPSVADELWTVSTASGDTTQSVNVAIVRNGGYVETATVQLNGTTPVQLGTDSDIVGITDYYLSATCAGQVKLLQTNGTGTELARIGVGQLRSRYVWIGLYPTPSASLTYNLEYEIEATDLVNSTDEPAWLPPRFHRLLAIGARQREYEQKADETRAAAALKEWGTGLASLLAYVNNPPDQTIVPGRTKPGISDLGAFFPAGTIWD